MDRYTPHHYGVGSPYASTSRITLEAMPRTLGSLSVDQATNNNNSPIFASQRSQDLRYHQSHHHIPLPSTVEGRVELNPLLLARYESLIRYNMASPPTTASAFGSNQSWMLEAATRPTLRSITITITSSELIPRPIIVHASNTNPFVVTIGDVLVAVHSALHTPATEDEYRLIILARRSIGNGYRNGMRRLDLLGGRHWWVGLSASQEGPEMWNLHLQR